MSGAEQSQEIGPHMFGELIFNKYGKKQFYEERIVGCLGFVLFCFCRNGAGTIRYPHAKKKKNPQSIIYYSYPIQKLSQNRS